MQSFRRQTLNQQLMDAIVGAIQRGELPAGTKLPAEAEMAASYRVSRNTLRETIKILEVFGIIESLHGQGTFISEFAQQRIPNIQIIGVLSENRSVQALLDARMVVEPGLAELAAQRRTEEDLALIANSEAVLLCGSSAVDPQRLFHLRVAAAAKCELLSSFLELLFQQLLHSPYPLLQDSAAADYNAEEVREHREIFESIVAGNGAEARTRMARHLRNRFDLLYTDGTAEEE
ncbi:MAG: GntR family transcriptional regulator [Oscillospiraceae bacterium]|nr:GntR family transcriptional regulator [Oscillospiraceae bacterium]